MKLKKHKLYEHFSIRIPASWELVPGDRFRAKNEKECVSFSVSAYKGRSGTSEETLKALVDGYLKEGYSIGSEVFKDSYGTACIQAVVLDEELAVSVGVASLDVLNEPTKIQLVALITGDPFYIQDECTYMQAILGTIRRV